MITALPLEILMILKALDHTVLTAVGTFKVNFTVSLLSLSILMDIPFKRAQSIEFRYVMKKAGIKA